MRTTAFAILIVLAACDHKPTPGPYDVGTVHTVSLGTRCVLDVAWDRYKETENAGDPIGADQLEGAGLIVRLPSRCRVKVLSWERRRAGGSSHVLCRTETGARGWIQTSSMTRVKPKTEDAPNPEPKPKPSHRLMRGGWCSAEDNPEHAVKLAIGEHVEIVREDNGRRLVKVLTGEHRGFVGWLETASIERGSR